MLMGLAGLGFFTLLSFRYPQRARARARRLLGAGDRTPALPKPMPSPAPAPPAAAVHVLPAPAPVRTDSAGSAEAIVTAAAQAHGLDPRVALMFADLESGLNPNVEHDRDWPFRNGCGNYRRHVLENPKFASNPARGEPGAWIGYGLFGLLSPYFAGPHEHPRLLLDPTTNAQRAAAFLKRKLDQSGGDIRQARLRFAGCWRPERCSPEKVALVDRRLQAAMRKWGLV